MPILVQHKCGVARLHRPTIYARKPHARLMMDDHGSPIYLRWQTRSRWGEEREPQTQAQRGLQTRVPTRTAVPVPCWKRYCCNDPIRSTTRRVSPHASQLPTQRTQILVQNTGKLEKTCSFELRKFERMNFNESKSRLILSQSQIPCLVCQEEHNVSLVISQSIHSSILSLCFFNCRFIHPSIDDRFLLLSIHPSIYLLSI